MPHASSLLHDAHLHRIKSSDSRTTFSSSVGMRPDRVTTRVAVVKKAIASDCYFTEGNGRGVEI